MLCETYKYLKICNKNMVGPNTTTFNYNAVTTTELEYIVIPKSVNGTDILYIGKYAFANIVKLKHVSRLSTS